VCRRAPDLRRLPDNEPGLFEMRIAAGVAHGRCSTEEQWRQGTWLAVLIRQR